MGEWNAIFQKADWNIFLLLTSYKKSNQPKIIINAAMPSPDYNQIKKVKRALNVC